MTFHSRFGIQVNSGAALEDNGWYTMENVSTFLSSTEGIGKEDYDVS